MHGQQNIKKMKKIILHTKSHNKAVIPFLSKAGFILLAIFNQMQQHKKILVNWFYRKEMINIRIFLSPSESIQKCIDIRPLLICLFIHSFIISSRIIRVMQSPFQIA